MNLFDGIDKKDLQSLATRLLVTIVAVIVGVTLINPVTESGKQLDKQINPLYQVAQDERLSEEKRAEAMNKIAALEREQKQNSLIRSVLDMIIMTALWTLLAGLAAYSYTKWRWSKPDDPTREHDPQSIQSAKIRTLGLIFSAVFIGNAIIYLAR